MDTPPWILDRRGALPLKVYSFVIVFSFLEDPPADVLSVVHTRPRRSEQAAHQSTYGREKILLAKEEMLVIAPAVDFVKCRRRGSGYAVIMIV